MIDTPEILQTREQPTAVIRFTIPREQISEVMGPGFAELMKVIGAQSIGPIGPAFSLHHRMDPGIFDFELGFPVSASVRAEGRVEPSRLPALEVARTIYHGPYEGLGPAWAELDAWLDANGHRPQWPLWERYVVGPESGRDPSEWQTELNHSISIR